MQFGLSFLLPTVILLYGSSSDRLGPIIAMLLALAFPVGYEVYRLIRRQKPSALSALAIVGIVTIGLVALLRLDAQWLAVRRALPYIAVAIGLLVLIKWKPILIEKGIEKLLAMEQVHSSKLTSTIQTQLRRATHKAATTLAIVCILTGIATYLLTLGFMSAPAGSAEFNAQYAELRIVSIFVISLPLLVVVTIILVRLVSSIERLTGIAAEDLLRKKPR